MASNTLISTAGIHERLVLLQREQAAAALAGLADNALYMQSLREDVEVTTSAFVGAAVTEIASLRAQLDAPLLG